MKTDNGEVDAVEDGAMVDGRSTGKMTGMDYQTATSRAMSYGRLCAAWVSMVESL
jgi:hypothetical protein